LETSADACPRADVLAKTSISHSGATASIKLTILTALTAF
jgi:hypothetical protein